MANSSAMCFSKLAGNATGLATALRGMDNEAWFIIAPGEILGRRMIAEGWLGHHIKVNTRKYYRSPVVLLSVQVRHHISITASMKIWQLQTSLPWWQSGTVHQLTSRYDHGR